MKKITLLALTALMVLGCDYRTNAEIEEAERLNGFNITVIDNCEYLKTCEGAGYQGYGYFSTKVTAVSVKSAILSNGKSVKRNWKS